MGRGCRSSAPWVSAWGWPETSVLPCEGIYVAGWDPWSPCVHALAAAGHQGCTRLWSDPSLPASPLEDSELGTSRKEPAAGGMLLVGLVVGGNGRQGGLVLGVAGHGGVHGHSVSSWVSAAVSPSPASPIGSAPGRQ